MTYFIQVKVIAFQVHLIMQAEYGCLKLPYTQRFFTSHTLFHLQCAFLHVDAGH